MIVSNLLCLKPASIISAVCHPYIRLLFFITIILAFFLHIMNHMMCNPLFGKQESKESIQNQAKIPESRRSKFRVAEPLPLGLRKKHTNKLNFNFMKILEKSSPLVTNLWFTKSMTLSRYKFQHTYSLNHIALENLSSILAAVPSCHTLSYTPLK